MAIFNESEIIVPTITTDESKNNDLYWSYRDQEDSFDATKVVQPNVHNYPDKESFDKAVAQFEKICSLVDEIIELSRTICGGLVEQIVAMKNKDSLAT